MASKTAPIQVDEIESAMQTARGYRMAAPEIAWMVAAAIRVPSLTMIATSRIESSLFDHSEAIFVLLWRGAMNAINANGGALPSDVGAAEALVGLYCSTEAATDPNGLYYTPHVQKRVFDKGLIEEVFAFKISGETEETGLNLMARFLRERTVSDPIKRALAGYGSNDVIADPDAVMNAIEKKARELIGMSHDPGTSAVIENFVPVGRKAVTTKMKFFDKLMNGGHANCECYALLGPSSGGKSAVALQLAMESAELEAATAAELGESQPRFWYYFSWELTEAQLRTRVYSYGARISNDSFADMAKYSKPYSTAENPDTLKPYEYEAYVNSPGNPLTGEKERLQALLRLRTGFGDNLKLVDYSGDRAGHGDNGIDGVVSYLRREEARGRQVGGIVIDYAKLVVDRLINARNMRPENQYLLLSSFGNMVRSKISIPFNCKSWVLHQLHGSAAKKRFGKLHSSDALGCKNFGDNFDFSIEFGMYNETTGLTEFSSSKHRHAAGMADGVVAKFDGRFGAFLDPDQEYGRDPSTGQLVPKDFLDRVPGSRQPGYRPATPVLNPLEGM